MATSDLVQIAEVEAQYAGPKGQPSLGRAFEMLLDRWRSGYRDRETGLRLLFLAWYSCAEPFQFTGLPPTSQAALVSELIEHFGGSASEDAEFLLALSVMSEEAPWCLDKSRGWPEASGSLLARSRQLLPGGFEQEHFSGRGAYGGYMVHMHSVNPRLGGVRHDG
jgi:hypothetical protein